MLYHGPDQLEGSRAPVTFTVNRRERWEGANCDYVGGGFECDEWMWWYRAVGIFDVMPGDVVSVVPAKDLLT